MFGQSNAANAGEARYAASPHVYVHRAGQCYPAHDPLVGSDGVDGSPWGRLGDKLVAAGLYDNVVIVAAAVSGVQMAAWAEGGSLNSILMARVSDAVSNGMKPDVYLLVQGEGDVLLTNPSAEADLPQIRAFAHGPAMTRHDWRDQFISALGSTIRRLGLVEPIYVSRVTRCNQRDANVRGTDLEKVIWRNPSYYIAAERTRIEVREGQLLGVNGFGVRAGPDLDTLPAELSFDGCHRSRRGLDESAKLWLTILSGGL